MGIGDGMPDSVRHLNYRALELVCREQAAIASSKETRLALEAMASEYQNLAKRQKTPKKNKEKD